ncbi:MAG: protein kinase [Planctomycetota bacterium]|nr:protein kinase [Planctomycetota bacterium]
MSVILCRKCSKSYKVAGAPPAGGASRCPSCGAINRADHAGRERREAGRRLPDAAPLHPDPAAGHRDAAVRQSPMPGSGSATEPADPRSDQPAADAPIARRIGPYEIVREIGRGGMGTVLMARDTALKRDVAIKFIGPESATQKEDRLRFIREARITGRLEHPGIPPVHFLARDEQGREFFVMKLIEGRALSDILAMCHSGDAATRREFPLPRLLAIFERVCETVGFAHSRGVIHRDLKPANVMVGDHGEIWVLDWGVAKEIDGEPGGKSGGEPAGSRVAEDGEAGGRSTGNGEDAGLTMAGTTVGTPEYMAPEQARGEKLDERTDIFGLGALLYEILVGHPPIRGSTREAVVCNAAMAKHVPIRQTARGRKIPPALAAIAEKCLRLDPKERYRSTAELVRDLRAFAAGNPVSAMPDTAMDRLRRFVRRNGTAVGASAAAVLLLAVLAAGAAVVIAQREREAAEAERAAREREAEAARAVMAARAKELEAAESRRKAQEAEAARERETALRLQAELEKQKVIAAGAERAARRLRAFEPCSKAMDLISRGQLPDRAAELARRALDIDPEFPEAQFVLAEALRAAGLPKDAADAYMKADAMSLRATSRHNLQALLSAAFAYDGAGYYREAERAFEIADSSDRDDPLAMVGRSFRAAHRGRVAEAARIAAEAAGRGPHLWETHFALGYAKAACARYGAMEPSVASREAVGHMRKALDLAPGRADIHFWLGHAVQISAEAEGGAAREATIKEALAACERAAAMEPRNGNRRVETALVKLALGDAEGARRELAEAASLGAHPATVKFAGARLAVSGGDIEAAFRLMDEAVRLGADWPPHIANWLNMAFSLGRNAQAQPVFEKFYAENPDFVEVYILKAELLRGSGNPHAALAEARKATAIAPYNVKALNAEASALIALGKYPEALETAGRLLKVRPGDYRGQVAKAQCLASLGRFAEARAAVAGLEKSHPARAAEIERLRQSIARLESSSGKR